MSRTSKALVGAVVLTAVGVGLYFAVTKTLEKKQLAEDAASSIKAELDALDPVTRAAVVAKLSTDAARDFRSKP